MEVREKTAKNFLQGWRRGNVGSRSTEIHSNSPEAGGLCSTSRHRRRQVSAREEFLKVAKLRGLRKPSRERTSSTLKELAPRSKVKINFQPSGRGKKRARKSERVVSRGARERERVLFKVGGGWIRVSRRKRQHAPGGSLTRERLTQTRLNPAGKGPLRGHLCTRFVELCMIVPFSLGCSGNDTCSSTKASAPFPLSSLLFFCRPAGLIVPTRKT